MRYVIKVADKDYEVEIEDLNARPIIARVDGQEFKVNPQDGVQLARRQAELKPVELPKQSTASNEGSNELTAPLPGTVIEIFVKTGEQIESGQVLLIIEAMKMKNSIRSTRSGKVMDVLVGPGETVAHKQPLVRFG